MVREENTTLQASCGKALALSSMANVSESLKSAVTDDKLKVLLSLNQNGDVDWQQRPPTRFAQTINLPAQWGSLTYSVNHMKQCKPDVLFLMERKQFARIAYGAAGRGGWKKQMLNCNDLDNVHLRDAKACPLPTGLLLRDNLEN